MRRGLIAGRMRCPETHRLHLIERALCAAWFHTSPFEQGFSL